MNKCVSGEYMASVLLGAFSKASSGVESEMTLSPLSILLRGFHCCIPPPSHLWSRLTGLSLETATVPLNACVLRVPQFQYEIDRNERNRIEI